MRSLTLILLFGLGSNSGSMLANAASVDSSTITFVANAENQTKPRVRFTGTAWAADPGGFLSGIGRGHRLLAEVAPGPGNFRIELDLSLPRVGRESVLVFGADNELRFASGTKQWTLRGRLFRAGDAPIAIAAPEIKPGQNFNLTVERLAAEISMKVNGAVLYRGPCGVSALTALGLDPDAGAVQLATFSARGVFPVASTPKAFGNPFGMQLRRAPTRADAIREPVILREAISNESSILCRSDGTLETYSVTKPASDSVTVLRSRDGGLTWSEPQVAFSLPGRAYYALQVLEAADGALHAAVHVRGEGPGGYRGRLYEVYHTRRSAGASAWSAPQRIVPGYIGAIRGFVQLARTGRLVLAVARAIPAREQPPKAGPDYGWNDTFVYLSDDQGTTWRQSPDTLSIELKTANVTRYGAIEPVLLELRDGRVWMLVRDRGGRLWQSFSADGERWPPLERTPFISSDSPAALLRLRDGKIVLLTNACQNWSDPRSYAMGGREVLHAAISADEGKSWRGFREIFHETDSVSGGDRGTSYATLAEDRSGRVVVVSGQGEGKRAILAFDPSWLEEDAVRDELKSGPAAWTQYGDEGLHAVAVDGGRAAAIPLKVGGLCGALWNFPLADSGELRTRIQIPPQVVALRLSLNDHFNRIDDRQAAEHAVFTMDLPTLGLAADGRWRDVTLRWIRAQGRGELRISVEGKQVAHTTAQRPAQFGVNYLRVEFKAATDQGDVLLANTSMRVAP